MSVLNFLLKNLQGCCLLFNYQESFSLLSSQRQLTYIITFTIACQQLFYLSFLLFVPIISVVRNSLSGISCSSTFVNNFFHFIYSGFSFVPHGQRCFSALSHATACLYYHICNRLSTTFYFFFFAVRFDHLCRSKQLI